MITHRSAARIFGIFFIIAFLAYGIGSGMIDSVTNTPDFLTNVYANQVTIIVGLLAYQNGKTSLPKLTRTS